MKYLKEVRKGHRPSLMKLLTECKYDPETVQNNKGETLLHLACQDGHLDIIRTLVEVFNCSWNVPDAFGNSPVHTACANNQLKVVAYFCEGSSHSQSIISVNDSGDTLLHAACRSGSVPLVRYVIQNACLGGDWYFPLKLNQYNDDTLSFIFLVKNNLKKMPSTNLVLQNNAGLTPIHTACSSGHLDILRLFFTDVKLCFDINLPPLIPSLLAIACKLKDYKVLDYLHDVSHNGVDTSLEHVILQVERPSSSFQIGLGIAIPNESVLFHATRCANYDLFNHLVSRHQSFNIINERGDTLLHAACVSCDIKMVKFIFDFLRKLKEDDMIHEKNSVGNTCLHLACEWGSLEITKLLIERGLKLNAVNNDGETPFHLSISHKRKDIFEYLLDQCPTDIDINAVTGKGKGETPLHIATSDVELFDFAERILSHPECKSIDSKDNFGDTPVFNACRTGDIQMIESLVDHGCDLLLVNTVTKETVANIACRLKRKDMLAIMLSRRFEFPQKLRNNLGQTLLHIACCNDDLEFLKYLARDDNNYNLSEDINLIDNVHELTPLQYACKNDNEVLFKELLEIPGCDPDTKNKNGDTVLHICCEMDLMNIAAICKSHASVTIRNEAGDTPLHVACRYENYDILLSLLEDNSNIKLNDYFNRKGLNLLHMVAAKENGSKILKFLTDKKLCNHTVKSLIEGYTALHFACGSNCLDNAIVLLQLDYSNGSWYSRYNVSPLFICIYNKAYDLLKEVSKFCSKKQLLMCNKEETASHDIVDTPVIHCLLECVSRFSVPSLNQMNRMKKASLQQNLAVNDESINECNKIIDLISHIFKLHPSFITSVDASGNTILHYVAKSPILCMEAFDEFVNKAIESNDVKQTNKFLSTPLHNACQREDMEWMVVKIMEHQEGCQVLNQQDSKGNTPAKFYTGNRESENAGCYYLIAHGANHSFNLVSDLRDKNPDALKYDPSIGIIVVGNSSVGKTTLIETLERMIINDRKATKNPTTKPTTGIVTSEFKNFKNNNSYIFYDFAGQIEFETMHSKMLENLISLAAASPTSPPFVFLLLVKGTDHFDVNKQQIDTWFSFVRRHVPVNVSSVHIVVICSHADCFESDTLRQKREKELIDYVKIFDAAPLNKHEIPIFLNGRKPDTPPLNRLLSYLEDRFISCDISGPVPLNSACHELIHHLPRWFSGKPHQVRDLVQKLKQCCQFELQNGKICMKEDHDQKLLIPQEPNALIEHLKILHVRNRIKLLMQPVDKLNWWIIDKDMSNILFNKVASIFSPDDFEDAPCDLRKTYNTGIIPSQKLSEIFSHVELDVNLIQQYLTSMEFCKPVEDEEILHLIAGDDGIKDGSTYFFFPGLLSKEKNKDLYKIDQSYSYKCGWLSRKNNGFGLQFLHSLLLSLTFKFASKSDSKYSRRLSLWKTGLFWQTLSGVEVLVEVIEDKKKVIALFRCASGKERLLSKHRCEILKEIREVQNRCSCSDGIAEYYFHPPPREYDYDSFASGARSKISLPEITNCFREEPDRRSVYVSNSEIVSLDKLLGFDSYISLSKEVIAQLENIDHNIFSALESQIGREALKKILEIETITDDSLYEEWKRRNEPKTTFDRLVEQLDKYSIFRGKELTHILV